MIHKRYPKGAIVLWNDSTPTKFDEVFVQETRYNI